MNGCAPTQAMSALRYKILVWVFALLSPCVDNLSKQWALVTEVVEDRYSLKLIAMYLGPLGTFACVGAQPYTPACSR